VEEIGMLDVTLFPKRAFKGVGRHNIPMIGAITQTLRRK
jgi:hypothetical protein